MLEAARWLHEAGRLDEAEVAYVDCLRADPNAVEALHLYATLQLQRGDAAGALASLRRAAAVHPTHALVATKLGWTLRATGDAVAALAALDRAVALDPSAAVAWFYRGVLLGERGETAAAEASYREAIRHERGFAEALNNLARLCEQRGEPAEAERGYRAAMNARPTGVAAPMNLARLLLRSQRYDEALPVLRAVLALDPTHPTALHLCAAIEGGASARAPADYVRGLFDHAAEHFERTLSGPLAYATPVALRALLAAHGPARVGRALDIGVGTGLMGEQIRDRCAHLTGVDLSPRMLAVAEEKGLYDVLTAADLEGYLASTAERFELFVAADVFNYLGDLRPAFAGLRRCAEDHAWVAFSVERHDGEGYALERSGRFRHAEEHVTARLADEGWTLTARRDATLRHEGGVPVAGVLILAEQHRA